jgi:hypothetical protein
MLYLHCGLRDAVQKYYGKSGNTDLFYQHLQPLNVILWANASWFTLNQALTGRTVQRTDRDQKDFESRLFGHR